MARDTAMRRMVQGDVGCGKTAIAFAAVAMACAQAGCAGRAHRAHRGAGPPAALTVRAGARWQPLGMPLSGCSSGGLTAKGRRAVPP